MRYSCTLSHVPISRQRAALHPGEPRAGKVLAWRVMGFGGKAYPLISARVSGVVIRLTQAAVQFSHPDLRGLLGQTYVDDPAFTFSGTAEANDFATNAVILLWLLFGLGLSWEKGGHFRHGSEHQWIGIHFSIGSDGMAEMRLPRAFVEKVAAELRPLATGRGSTPLIELHAVVSRVGRIAHIIPESRPYSGALWAALSAAQQADSSGRFPRRLSQTESWT